MQKQRYVAQNKTRKQYTQVKNDVFQSLNSAGKC